MAFCEILQVQTVIRVSIVNIGELRVPIANTNTIGLQVCIALGLHNYFQLQLISLPVSIWVHKIQYDGPMTTTYENVMSRMLKKCPRSLNIGWQSGIPVE